MHHPFTAANPDDLQGNNGASLKTARAIAYDLVYNGVEIAGMDHSCMSRIASEKIRRVLIASMSGAGHCKPRRQP